MTFTSTSTIQQTIIQEAIKSNVDVSLALYVAEHESNLNSSAVGDMNITCRRTGQPVRARGIYQITSCYHPEVSDAQAFNPDFSIKWAMNILGNKKLCMGQFTTCRDFYTK